jgi:RNA polymerase sigma factor (sigma-70 family)
VHLGKKEKEFIENLYFEMFPLLFSVARSHIRNLHRAEELAQEVFQIALERIDAIMLSPNPEGWLQNTLKNIILHELRARKQLAEMLVEIETLTENELSGSQNNLLLEVQSVLTQEEWDILKRIYIEGYTVTELANNMGLKYDTCRKRINTILSKARKHLTDEE